MKVILKSTIKKLLLKYGLELRRLPKESLKKDVILPIIHRYSINYKNSIKPCEFDFWLANNSALEWYHELFYGSDNPSWELDEFSWLLEPGDRVLEIGCHHGFLTMMMAHCVGSKGFIFSIDALPENAMVAQANIALNDLGQRCVVKNLAGGSSAGSIKIEMRTNSHVLINENNTDKNSIEVPVVTGDSLDQEFGPFNVLKIDVEGFEAEVLKGCTQLLRRHPKLIMELHPKFMMEYGYGATLQDIYKLLGIHDYRGTAIARPHFSTVRKFDPAIISENDVTNVHLWFASGNEN